MKKTKKRLSLNRETLRALAPETFEQVRGGAVVGGIIEVPKGWTKRAGTCTSCDGPDSCRKVCMGTVPL